jgi:NTP pyrophosphatase (non-canonical NTP hydrolase)
MEKTLNELRDEIYSNAVDHGFYEDTKHLSNIVDACAPNYNETFKHSFFAQKIALIHSELSEALEADRKGKYANISLFERLTWDTFSFQETIKDTVEDELTDALIRILDLAGYMGIDIEKHVELKMKYNALREYKHNKKY